MPFCLSHSAARTQLNPVWFQDRSPIKGLVFQEKHTYEKNLPFPSSFCTYKPTSTTRNIYHHRLNQNVSLGHSSPLIQEERIVDNLVRRLLDHQLGIESCNSNRLYSWQDQQVERLWQGKRHLWVQVLGWVLQVFWAGLSCSLRGTEVFSLLNDWPSVLDPCLHSTTMWLVLSTSKPTQHQHPRLLNIKPIRYYHKT